ncbi:MAG: TraR/DksA family transcriptional regulator [Kofleriaceae bacterium]
MAHPSGLTEDQLALLKDDLLRLRTTLVGRLEPIVKPTMTNEPGDPADHATELAGVEAAQLHESRDRARLAEVDAALDRIARGTYGISERSGAPIGFDRLRAIPWARTAVDE